MSASSVLTVKKAASPVGSTPQTSPRKSTASAPTLQPYGRMPIIAPRSLDWSDEKSRRNPAFGQVHRRQTYKSFNESVFRRADLLHGSAIHDDDPVGESHGFDLIMRDANRRDLESTLQMLDLNARCPAQLRIQVRKRLVHQERARMPDDRPRQGRALTLAMLSTSNASPRHPEKRDAPSQRLVNSDSGFSARHQSAAIRGYIEFWV